MRFKLPAGNLPAALREWRTIEFKAVLTAGSTNTVVSSVTKTDDQTPYFYDLQCEYDNDIKN